MANTVHINMLLGSIEFRAIREHFIFGNMAYGCKSNTNTKFNNNSILILDRIYCNFCGIFAFLRQTQVRYWFLGRILYCIIYRWPLSTDQAVILIFLPRTATWQISLSLSWAHKMVTFSVVTLLHSPPLSSLHTVTRPVSTVSAVGF